MIWIVLILFPAANCHCSKWCSLWEVDLIAEFYLGFLQAVVHTVMLKFNTILFFLFINWSFLYYDEILKQGWRRFLKMKKTNKKKTASVCANKYCMIRVVVQNVNFIQLGDLDHWQRCYLWSVTTHQSKVVNSCRCSSSYCECTDWWLHLFLLSGWFTKLSENFIKL